MKDLGDSGDYPRLSRWVQYNHIGPDKREGGGLESVVGNEITCRDLHG